MKVLAAIDDWPYSGQMIDSILKSHFPKNMKFRVVTVLEPLSFWSNGFGPSEFSTALTQIHERRQQAAKKLCEEVCHKLGNSTKCASVSYEVREGTASTEIVNAAVDWLADKIIIGAHDGDVCPRYLLGSVSRAVVDHAPCSVEIVRTRLHRKRQPVGKAEVASAPKK
jgi:nucleotide-binding universal stress UspA family protein